MKETITWLGGFATAVYVAAISAFAARLGEQVRNLFDLLAAPLKIRMWRRLFAAETVRSYCNRILEVTKTLKVTYLRTTSKDFDGLFVRLHLDGPAGIGAYDSSTVLTNVNTRRIMVSGDAGSGKSSLSWRLARDACWRAKRHPADSLLPIMIKLGDRSLKLPSAEMLLAWPAGPIDAGTWFLDHHVRLTVGKENSKLRRLFDLQTHGNGILLLLDGLDEVPSDRFTEMCAFIGALSATLYDRNPNNVIVLTMRTQIHQRAAQLLGDTFATSVTIKPFSPSDIFDFILRWFRDPPDPLATANVSHALNSASPSVRELCGNPLMLTLFLLNYTRAEPAAIPSNRTGFYEDVITELLVRWLVRQGRDPQETHALVENLNELFGKIAFNNLLNLSQAANSAEWCQCVELAATQWAKDETLADIQLREIGLKTGIYVEEPPRETLSFIHLTIAEYFAALSTVDYTDKGWQQVIATHRTNLPDGSARPRLQQVIQFAIGHMKGVHRKDALTDVFELGDAELYARSVFETKAYDHPHWPGFVRTEHAAIINTPPAQWDPTWLRRLHLFHTVMTDAEVVRAKQIRIVQMPNIDVHTLFAELATIDRDRLVTVLAAYFQSDPVAALHLADESGLNVVDEIPDVAVDACNNPQFLAKAVERVSAGPPDDMRFAQVLVEAALRGSKVADELNAYEASSSLREQIDRIPQQGWWGAGRLQARAPLTLLEACLTLIWNSDPDSLNNHFTSSHVTQFLRVSPAHRIIRIAWRRLAVSTCLLLAGCLVALSGLTLPPDNLTGHVTTGAGMLIAMSAFIWTLMAAVGRYKLDKAYARMIGLAGARNTRFNRLVRACLRAAGANDVLTGGHRLA